MIADTCGPKSVEQPRLDTTSDIGYLPHIRQCSSVVEERKLLVDASRLCSFSRPQKSISFLENIGTLSSIRVRIYHKE